MKLQLLTQASEEFEAAADWYEAQVPGLGKRFVSAVNITLHKALIRPQTGAPVSGFEGVRKMRVERFPYSVVYFQDKDVLQVVAVVHGRRKPYFWRNRL